MNNKCWYCNDKLGSVTFEWEMPCECGALNFVKACRDCYLEHMSTLFCKVCDEPLNVWATERRRYEAAYAKDEEDIT